MVWLNPHKEVISNSYKKLEKPKREGGLGIMNMIIWNLAALSKHFHNLITNTDSPWVKWSITLQEKFTSLAGVNSISNCGTKNELFQH